MNGIYYMTTKGLYYNGKPVNEVSIPIEYPVMPIPDLEASRIYWDEKTQSVKQEIIKLSDMRINPTNNSGDKNGD